MAPALSWVCCCVTGYSRNKYESTGIIQWMLNNAWPEMVWHLYDWWVLVFSF